MTDLFGKNPLCSRVGYTARQRAEQGGKTAAQEVVSAKVRIRGGLRGRIRGQVRGRIRGQKSVGRQAQRFLAEDRRGSAPRLTLLPWLQFFLPTPTFALQCFRLISTIQLLHISGAPVLGAQLLEHYFKQHHKLQLDRYYVMIMRPTKLAAQLILCNDHKTLMIATQQILCNDHDTNRCVYTVEPIFPMN